MIGKVEKSSCIAFPFDQQVLDPHWLDVNGAFSIISRAIIGRMEQQKQTCVGPTHRMQISTG